MTFDGKIGIMDVNVTGTTVTLIGLQEAVNYAIAIRVFTTRGGIYGPEVTVRTTEAG